MSAPMHPILTLLYTFSASLITLAQTLVPGAIVRGESVGDPSTKLKTFSEA